MKPQRERESARGREIERERRETSEEGVLGYGRDMQKVLGTL
jgi:hypothetical protein